MNLDWILLNITYIFLLNYIVLEVHSLVKLESYTEKERNAIDTLRNRVKNALYADYMHEDNFLFPWIEDRKFNLDAAQEKLLKSLKWRKENSIDNILNDAEVKKFVSQHLPFSIIGRDEFGGPITEWKVGPIWKIRKLVLAGKLQQMVQFYPYYGETVVSEIRKARKESGYNITQGYLITDFLGYNLKEHGCLACIPFFTTGVGIYENNYVGKLKYIAAVNAPKIFENLGQILRSLMSPATKEAFKVFSIQDKLEVKKLFADTNPKFISREYAL